MGFLEDLQAETQGKIVNPDTVVSQVENMLSFLTGQSTPAGTPSEMTGQPTTADAATSPTNLGSADHANPVEGGNAPINQPFHEGHAGVDIGVPVGSHMIAAISGTVTRAVDEPGGYGNLVEITGPGGISVRYGHLSNIGVQVGQTVTAGESIGVSGGAAGAPGAGNSTGPHLHFEVRQNGQPVDPAAFLAGGAAIVGAAPASSAGASGTAQPAPLSPEELVKTQIDRATAFLSGEEAPEDPSTTSTQSDQGTAAATGSWSTDLLSGIGAPLTPENISMMENWMAHEGGANHNNPLNTMLDMPGATLWNQQGVKTYGSYEQGLQANVKTLLQANMAGIVAAFRSGNPDQIRAAIRNSPWGTTNI